MEEPYKITYSKLVTQYPGSYTRLDLGSWSIVHSILLEYKVGALKEQTGSVAP